jgi:outer membrane immunogenic protein
VPAKAPPAPVAFNWSGCYIGAEGGGSWGRSEQVAAAGANAGSTITGGFDLNGGLAGGTGGCNLQYDNFVFGIEDDVSWTNEHGSASDRPPFVTTATSQTSEKWINTLRPRLGYAFDRFLVYGTAGVALASTEVLVSNPTFGTLVDHQEPQWLGRRRRRGVGRLERAVGGHHLQGRILAHRLRIGTVFQSVRPGR